MEPYSITLLLFLFAFVVLLGVDVFAYVMLHRDDMLVFRDSPESLDDYSAIENA